LRSALFAPTDLFLASGITLHLARIGGSARQPEMHPVFGSYPSRAIRNIGLRRVADKPCL